MGFILRRKREAKKPVWRRPDAPNWFMTLYDNTTGKMMRKTTGTDDYGEAMRIWRREQDRLDGKETAPTVLGLVRLYEDPSTNPRYLQARREGSHYSPRYASFIAGRARRIEEVLSDRVPLIADKHIDELRRADIREIREALRLSSPSAPSVPKALFKAFKVMLSQAVEDGLIEMSPAEGSKDIPYDERKRAGFPEDPIRRVIAAKDSFPYLQDWAFFTVLASTGMRIGEAIAISDLYIIDNDVIDVHSLKSNDADDIGLPKWDIERMIPLPKLALYALSEVGADRGGRYFHMTLSAAECSFRRTMALASSLFPEDRDVYAAMTPHTLRHSANSNLLYRKASPLLVAEYLSWNHQTQHQLMEMQRRYTHVFVEHLREVADKLDEIYMPEGWEDRLGLPIPGRRARKA